MTDQTVDNRAIIDPSAEIGEGVKIGPWSIIGAGVKIGDNTEIASHVVVKGSTTIGKNNRILQFSSIGEDTPDLKYKGEDTRLIIGDNNVIREGVTIHRGTVQDASETVIGNDNLLMAYVHIGHDSRVGNHCIFVNNASLAGHVDVGDWSILSGYTLVHQYCYIGAHSFTGMGSAVGKDIPAFVTVAGAPAAARSINAEGLKRRGFSKEQITNLNKAFKIIYRRGLTLENAMEELLLLPDDGEIKVLYDSLTSSKRGIVR
ncbi:acyl-ACP--UDP-N-acetylglucosamine O-acyltransferase [Agarilytica rhodophyticola]|uniref:acyl-ACP--UDP-N-acetylglucosamine O-acyltransferase n=1 Tax=Agarilytica rhodophyticola TaxID=1737490 RepID=UPI000B344774|nr:acyl-ACP--UDP-N-acetylglucosamine O-acyltransferase [Agarilytica rhodophyticola]